MASRERRLLAAGLRRFGPSRSRCSASTTFADLVLPHLRMLPAILRMIVPAVSGESRARGAPGRAARWFTLDRSCHGAGGDHSGCSRIRYVTVCNSLVVLTNTERKARYQAAEGWRAPVPPASGRESQERSRRNGGTTFRRELVGHPATCSVTGRGRPVFHSGAEYAAAREVLRGRVGIGVGLGGAATAPAPGGRLSPFRVSGARDNSPPEGVVDGRDDPSRPGARPITAI